MLYFHPECVLAIPFLTDKAQTDFQPNKPTRQGERDGYSLCRMGFLCCDPVFLQHLSSQERSRGPSQYKALARFDAELSIDLHRVSFQLC